MYGLDRGCTTKSLLRALAIIDTKTHLKILKLEFYKRLIRNRFTGELLVQVEQENTKDSFITEIDEAIKGVSGIDGTSLSRSERVEIQLSVIKALSHELKCEDPLVAKVKKILDSRNKTQIAAKLVNLLHYTNTGAQQA